MVDPRSLHPHGSVKRLFPLVSQKYELRPPVVWVGLEDDEPFLVQIIDDPLDVLAIRPEVSGEPRDRFRSFSGDNGAEDLPAGARQPEPRDQPIPRCQEPVIEPEEIEHQISDCLTGGRSLLLAHIPP